MYLYGVISEQLLNNVQTVTFCHAPLNVSFLEVSLILGWYFSSLSTNLYGHASLAGSPPPTLLKIFQTLLMLSMNDSTPNLYTYICRNNKPEKAILTYHTFIWVVYSQSALNKHCSLQYASFASSSNSRFRSIIQSPPSKKIYTLVERSLSGIEI